MFMKKPIAFLAMFAMLLGLCACGEPDVAKTVPNSEIKEAQIYREYSHLIKIGAFSNGVAPFVIHEASNTLHTEPGGYRTWWGEYYLGYIDVHGNVITEPIYEHNPFGELPIFEGEYVSFSDLNNNEYLLDKQGNVLLQSGKGDVSRIGKTSYGYFGVETFEETLAGVTYTVRYYRAKDNMLIATFENMRAIPNNSHVGEKNSNVTSTGAARLVYNLDKGYYSKEDIQDINIADYDNSFSLAQSNWNVDMNNVNGFGGAESITYHVSDKTNQLGELATVVLQNSNGTYYYAVVDRNGNVLLEPQRDVEFPLKEETDIHKYEFCMNMCPARDADTKLWGYIDPNGNWVIQPQYYTASAFSAEGYATINEEVVIDTKGAVVLAPKDYVNEVVTTLSGRYIDTREAASLTFSEDGTLAIRNGFRTDSGKYEICGGVLITSDMDSWSSLLPDGEYTFVKIGDTLLIDGIEYFLSNDG